MNKIIFILIVIPFFFLSGETEDISREKILLDKFEIFQGKLKTELQKAIKGKGFAGAVEICNQVSPAIENESSTDGISIKRISDKPRNLQHNADKFEAKVIATWKKELAKGNKPAVVSKMTSAGFRTMKPIMIQDAVCLKCHGGAGETDAGAISKITQLYPADKATGYKMGDLRGAFSGLIKKQK